MGDSRNKIRHFEKTDRIMAGLPDPAKARLVAAVRHLMLPRCACGFTWYDAEIYSLPKAWGEAQAFCCRACCPDELRHLIEGEEVPW